VSDQGKASTNSCNQTQLPLTTGVSNNYTLGGTYTSSNWEQSIFYADSGNDDVCKDLDEVSCKESKYCGYDPTSAKSMCGSSCCGVNNTAGKGSSTMQNNGIGIWSQMLDLGDNRVSWAKSCEYAARNTLYNYDYTSCYTSGSDIRTKQYLQVAKSTQNMCDASNSDYNCDKICNCKSSVCNSVECEIMNVAVMGSSVPTNLLAGDFKEVMNEFSSMLAQDGSYIGILIAIIAWFA
jgi:hypothetical protein